MTDILSRLDELRAVAEKATPGPWTSFYKSKYDEWHVSLPVAGQPSGLKVALCRDGLTSPNRENDAPFIAAADPSTVLSLLDTIAAQAEEIERLKGRLAHSENECMVAHNECSRLRLASTETKD